MIFSQALAQAILDGAGISLPGGLRVKSLWKLLQTSEKTISDFIKDNLKTFLWPGSLVECYDELGTRYSIPVYCLSLPVNLVVEGAGDR